MFPFLQHYFKDRVKLLYPKFRVSLSLKRFLEKYNWLDSGQKIPEEKESLAGRVLGIKKLKNSTIYSMHGGGAIVPIKVDARAFGSVKHGDIIGVVGCPGKENSGELLVYPNSLQVLSPCLRHMPQLLKQENRARNRFLDLILTKHAREVFEVRSRIISYMRSFLHDLDFQEVETPILDCIPGVGAGCPFMTKYKNSKMYLRVAPEIHLKKLLVGGVDRVFEIGKQFRNEGIDATHHPEFTSCELYMSYTDYEDMMELTELLLSGLVKELTGGFVIKCQSNGLDKKPIDIDFTPPFKKIDLLEGLEKEAGLSIPRDLESSEASQYLKNECQRLGLEYKPFQRTGRLLDKLVNHFLVPSCVNPTFIVNHPRVMSMMAKSHEFKPEITERFELYVNNQELCNAYTELNDPMEQRQRFAEIIKELEPGEHEATILDEQFCEALEYGLPPSAGWGIGIDRLVMLLTCSQNIKDVTLFPLMRRQNKNVENLRNEKCFGRGYDTIGIV